jgi:hypothetical protein
MRQIMIRCDDHIADLVKQIAYLESRSVNRQVIHMIQSHPLAEKAKAIPISEIKSVNAPKPKKEPIEPDASTSAHARWKVPDEWFGDRD